MVDPAVGPGGPKAQALLGRIRQAEAVLSLSLPPRPQGAFEIFVRNMRQHYGPRADQIDLGEAWTLLGPSEQAQYARAAAEGEEMYRNTMRQMEAWKVELEVCVAAGQRAGLVDSAGRLPGGEAIRMGDREVTAAAPATAAVADHAPKRPRWGVAAGNAGGAPEASAVGAASSADPREAGGRAGGDGDRAGHPAGAAEGAAPRRSSREPKASFRMADWVDLDEAREEGAGWGAPQPPPPPADRSPAGFAPTRRPVGRPPKEGRPPAGAFGGPAAGLDVVGGRGGTGWQAAPARPSLAVGAASPSLKPWLAIAGGRCTPLRARWSAERCAVCASDADAPEDLLVSCRGCGIAVHQTCYGIASGGAGAARAAGGGREGDGEGGTEGGGGAPATALGAAAAGGSHVKREPDGGGIRACEALSPPQPALRTPVPSASPRGRSSRPDPRLASWRCDSCEYVAAEARLEAGLSTSPEAGGGRGIWGEAWDSAAAALAAGGGGDGGGDAPADGATEEDPAEWAARAAAPRAPAGALGGPGGWGGGGAGPAADALASARAAATAAATAAPGGPARRPHRSDLATPTATAALRLPRRPRCCLCPVTGGALKPTTIPGLWAHLADVHAIAEIGVEDVSSMSPVTNVAGIQPERWELRCQICRRSAGALLQCHGCFAAFHPLCARASGLPLARADDGQGGVTVLAACHKHAPPGTVDRARAGLTLLRGRDARASAGAGAAADRADGGAGGVAGAGAGNPPPVSQRAGTGWADARPRWATAGAATRALLRGEGVRPDPRAHQAKPTDPPPPRAAAGGRAGGGAGRPGGAPASSAGGDEAAWGFVCTEGEGDVSPPEEPPAPPPRPSQGAADPPGAAPEAPSSDGPALSPFPPSPSFPPELLSTVRGRRDATSLLEAATKPGTASARLRNSQPFEPPSRESRSAAAVAAAWGLGRGGAPSAAVGGGAARARLLPDSWPRVPHVAGGRASLRAPWAPDPLPVELSIIGGSRGGGAGVKAAAPRGSLAVGSPIASPRSVAAGRAGAGAAASAARATDVALLPKSPRAAAVLVEATAPGAETAALTAGGAPGDGAGGAPGEGAGGAPAPSPPAPSPGVSGLAASVEVGAPDAAALPSAKPEPLDVAERVAAAAAPPPPPPEPRSLPATLAVRCGSLGGSFAVPSGPITLESGEVVSMAEFERRAGKGGNKKWRSSIRVEAMAAAPYGRGGECTLGEWISQATGLSGPPQGGALSRSWSPGGGAGRGAGAAGPRAEGTRAGRGGRGSRGASWGAAPAADPPAFATTGGFRAEAIFFPPAAPGEAKGPPRPRERGGKAAYLRATAHVVTAGGGTLRRPPSRAWTGESWAAHAAARRGEAARRGRLDSDPWALAEEDAVLGMDRDELEGFATPGVTVGDGGSVEEEPEAPKGNAGASPPGSPSWNLAGAGAGAGETRWVEDALGNRRRRSGRGADGAGGAGAGGPGAAADPEALPDGRAGRPAAARHPSRGVSAAALRARLAQEMRLAEEALTAAGVVSLDAASDDESDGGREGLVARAPGLPPRDARRTPPSGRAPSAPAGRPGAGTLARCSRLPAPLGWLPPGPGRVASPASRLRLATSLERSRLAFGKSGIHGWGVFARVPIRADSPLYEYRGELADKSDADALERMHRAAGRDCYLFSVDGDTVVDATLAGSIARLTNHSCAPSTYTRALEVDGHPRLVFFALADLAPGQEITYNYRFLAQVGEARLPCFCGAPNCDGFLD